MKKYLNPSDIARKMICEDEFAPEGGEWTYEEKVRATEHVLNSLAEIGSASSQSLQDAIESAGVTLEMFSGHRSGRLVDGFGAGPDKAYSSSSGPAIADAIASINEIAKAESLPYFIVVDGWDKYYIEQRGAEYKRMMEWVMSHDPSFDNHKGYFNPAGLTGPGGLKIFEDGNWEAATPNSVRARTDVRGGSGLDALKKLYTPAS